MSHLIPTAQKKSIGSSFCFAQLTLQASRGPTIKRLALAPLLTNCVSLVIKLQSREVATPKTGFAVWLTTRN